MFRFLLISFLVLYVLYKLGRFFMRMGAAMSRPRYQAPYQEQANKQEHHDTPRYSKRERSTRDEGTYIDYEEVKEKTRPRGRVFYFITSVRFPSFQIP
jgi:hypothetical protein